MDYIFILRPIIGAIIGLITNWIAVKMLFKPIKPVKIGKFRLPFTPGLIPKNMPRIADAIGNSVSNDLLNAETLKEALLSEHIKGTVKQKIIDSLNTLEYNNNSIKTTLLNQISEENYNKIYDTASNKLTNTIFERVKEANLGAIVAEQISEAAEEKFKGSMLGHLGGNALANVISHTAEEKVDAYIDEHGIDTISEMVHNELDSLTNESISSIATTIAESEIDLVSILMNVYENTINEKLESVLEEVNISKIVSDKINTMDVKEVERIILQIMKKELNALIYLGALIGFVLGLLNLLF